MNDYWGPPRHDLPPAHALPNPTDPYQHQGIGGGQGEWSPPGNGGAPVYSGAPVVLGSGGRSKRSIPIAILLALLLGPLGLFYVNLLSGIAALTILPLVLPKLIFATAAAVGGGTHTVDIVLLPVLWSVCIPWAIIGVKIRNARIDRAG